MLRIRSLLALTAVVSGVFASSAAFAAEPAAAGGEFGEAGVINFAAATNLGLEIGSSKAPDSAGGGKTSTTRFTIQPSIDYFIVDNLSIGALVSYSHFSSKPEGATDSDSSSTFAIGPRVGYNLWLTPGQLSLWPSLSLLYSTSSSSSAGKDGPSFNRVGLDIFVPLLIHPVKHFHFAIGPFVGLDLSSKIKPAQGDSVDGSKDTTFGLRGEIAGWL